MGFDRLMLKLKTCPRKCIIQRLPSRFCEISCSEFWETQSSSLQAPRCSLAQPTRSVAGALSVILSVSNPLFFSLCGIDSCTKFKYRFFSFSFFFLPRNRRALFWCVLWFYVRRLLFIQTVPWLLCCNAAWLWSSFERTANTDVWQLLP